MLYETKNPHGGDHYGEEILLDFSANTNPYGTPRSIQEAVSSGLGQLHRYPDPFCRDLVRAIAAFESVPEGYILCGNGAAELIYSYCEALAPEKAAELAPAFSEYSLALDRTGSRIFRYPLSQKKDFRLDRGIFAFLEKNKPQVLFLCNPNNPTGQLIPPSLLEELLVCCGEKNIRLFVDECFLDLSSPGASLTPLLSAHPHLFLLKAFTKSYGMAGIRLGYGMTADPSLLRRMSSSVQPWNVSSLAQLAGAAALREQDFIRRTRKTVAEERIWLRERLEALGLWVCPSGANYLLFSGPKNLHQALKAHHIAIRNCENYPNLSPGWYRIAVRLHEENKRLISALHTILEGESSWQKI